MTYLVIGLLVEAATAALFLYLWRHEQDKSRAYRALSTLRGEQLTRLAEKHAAERVALEDKISRLESVIGSLDSRTNELVQVIIDNGGPGLADLGRRVLRNPYDIAADTTAPRGMRVVAPSKVDTDRGGD